jgi:hypothetical protein
LLRRTLTVRAAVTTAVLLALTAGTARAGTNTVTFGEQGEYPIVIPAGVTSLQVVAIGGKGGTGNYWVEGGFGARVTATIPVTGGATRYVVVAGNGLEGSPRAGAGSGGGASDIRTTPVAQGVTSTDTRLLVAGGGGGSGRGVNSGAAGSAGIGGDAGMPGGASRRDGGLVGGGGAGTSLGGGAGGTANPDRWGQAGWPGERGVGGNGGLAGTLGFPSEDQQASGGYNGGGWAGGGRVNYRPGGWETFYGGGGGGGGLHGGGGGGGVVPESTNDSGGGGGGGSSLVPAGGTAAIDTTGSPSITISFEDSVRPVVGLNATPAATSRALTVSGTAGTVLGDGAVTIDVYAGAAASGAPVLSRALTHDARTGAYETSLGALPDGQYSVRATQVDGAGNVGLSTTRTFVEDTTRPVISLTTPASGTVTDEPAPTFAGVAGTTPRDARPCS